MTTAVQTDLVVIGAGPAGANAALAAAEAGIAVHLVDEAPQAGGQVWRAPVDGVAAGRSPDARAGADLRARVAASCVAVAPSQRVWSVLRQPDGLGFRVDGMGPDGPLSITAPRLVAATGAYERIVPFPGWTLPGVIGLAGATILLKSHGVVPGQRIVVAGAGPLLLAVAAGLLDAGVKPLALVDLDGRRDWLARLPALATRPHLAARGARWRARISAAGIPVFHRHAVRDATGGDCVETVTLAPVDATGAFTGGNERSFDVDALVVGHGLTPGADIPRLLHAETRYDGLRGGVVPIVDRFGRTSVPGLFAVGDGAGVRGADAAVAAGRLCGLAAAHDAGRVGPAAFDADAAPLLRAAAGHRRFSDAIAGAFTVRPGQVASVPGSAAVCRCEDVTRRDIETAAEDGARDVNQMKHFTRCGMGPCQGRICGEVAAWLLALKLGVPRDAVGSFTARPPLRPVAIGDLIGSFSYGDIPIPEPAPL